MLPDIIVTALIILVCMLLCMVLLALLHYIISQLTLKRFPAFAVRQWAMSGLWLEELPAACPFKPYGCTDCKNWTCPEYSRLHKPRDEQTYI